MQRKSAKELADPAVLAADLPDGAGEDHLGERQRDWHCLRPFASFQWMGEWRSFWCRAVLIGNEGTQCNGTTARTLFREQASKLAVLHPPTRTERSTFPQLKFYSAVHLCLCTTCKHLFNQV